MISDEDAKQCAGTIHDLSQAVLSQLYQVKEMELAAQHPQIATPQNPDPPTTAQLMGAAQNTRTQAHKNLGGLLIVAGRLQSHMQAPAAPKIAPRLVGLLDDSAGTTNGHDAKPHDGSTQ